MVNELKKKRTHLGILIRVTMAVTLLLSIIHLGRARAGDGAAGTPAAHIESSSTQPSAIDGMIRIPAGSFAMGYEGEYDDERPVHQVYLSAFDIDRHEVTNEEFSVFVEATGHLTQAEQDGECWSYIRGTEAFQSLQGADWRHPQGSGSSIDDRMDHPVVCVNWHDAAAYANWAGKRLPTEAEWEYVARAGTREQFVANTATDLTQHATGHSSHKHKGATGDASPSSKSHLFHTAKAESDQPNDAETRIEANVWQGHWPDTNALADGFFYTAPAESFEPNAWGVSDMLGNVWEWTGDWYSADYYNRSPESDPPGADSGAKRVARGGSWFCSPNYCGAYSTHYRGASPPDRAFNNVGFRCARDAQ